MQPGYGSAPGLSYGPPGRFQGPGRARLQGLAVAAGQIFSDAGVPVVLFMENYDINRSGYHDSQDTMARIDLDYGAALAAIVIETVARAATERYD